MPGYELLYDFNKAKLCFNIMAHRIWWNYHLIRNKNEKYIEITLSQQAEGF